ncbi:hypothetical protein MRBLRC7O_000099 [Agrobacterium radiobacter]|uniref:DUF6538 domain-containing protein n=1 Tax=Agrobacterium radiobacter TaxID=362 RepID=UPI003466D92E
MFIPSYILKSRHGVFYFRWPLPKQLHPRQKSETIKLSLRTRDPRKALRLSRSLIQIGEELVEDGIAYGMRYDEIRAALIRHFKDLLEKKKHDIAATGRLSLSDREKFIARHQEVQKAIDNDTPIPTNKTEDELLATFIRKYQLNILPDSEQYRWLQRDIKPAFRSLIASVLAYDDSLDHFDLGQSIPVASASLPMPIPSLKKTTVTLDDLSERFIAERSLGNNWVPRTKLEKRDHIDL